MTIEKYELGGYKLRLFEYRERWALEIKKGNARKIKSLKTKDLGAAKDEFYKYKLELKEKGRLDIIFDTDLFRQIEIFLSWSKMNSGSRKTYKSHKQTILRFRDFLEQKKADTITPTLYEEFKQYLSEMDLSPRTINIYLSTIGRMITILEQLEIIPRSVYPRPTMIKAKKVLTPKFWSLDEVSEILKTSRSTYIHDMLLVALNTGLRLNELRYLRWEDINLEKGFLLVQSHLDDGFNPKDYEIRRIKLNHTTRKVLAELKLKQGNDIAYVFANKYGKPRINNLERDLMKILKRIEIQGKGGWHCARRTWGSHAIMAGADPKSVQKLYGHSELKTTEAYLNVTEKHLDETVELVNFEDEVNQGKIIDFRKG